MCPHEANSCRSDEFCSFIPVNECENSTSGKPSVAPSRLDAGAGGSATGTSTRASILTNRK